MKNIYKYLFVGLLFTVFTSCDKEGLIVFDTPDGFVQLGGSPATSIGEDSGSPVATRVELGMSNPDGISVVFTTQSADDSRYQVLTASPLNIPAGQTFAEILIQPVDNFDVDGNIDVTLALVSADAPIGLAGDGLERVSRTITIIDNWGLVHVRRKVQVMCLDNEAPGTVCSHTYLHTQLCRCQ